MDRAKFSKNKYIIINYFVINALVNVINLSKNEKFIF